VDKSLQITNLAIVRRLCEEWPRLTREGFQELLAPDCFYVNIPWSDQPRIGPDQAYEALSRYHDGWRVDLEVIHILADDDVVLTERLERFQKPGESSFHDLYVMGVFEMKDGKIAKWRDYFDSKHVQLFLD
jgi:limonene-1,2-epoxide hydrolase